MSTPGPGYCPTCGRPSAEQEAAERSARIRAGLQRRKAQGLPIGRIPGATDIKPRRGSRRAENAGEPLFGEPHP